MTARTPRLAAGGALLNDRPYRVNQEPGSRLPTGACTDHRSAVYRRCARWLVLRQQSQLGGLQPPTSTPLATASDDHTTRLWETNVNNVAAGICNHPRYHQKRVGPIHARPDLPTPMRVSHLLGDCALCGWRRFAVCVGSADRRLRDGLTPHHALCPGQTPRRAGRVNSGAGHRKAPLMPAARRERSEPRVKEAS